MGAIVAVRMGRTYHAAVGVPPPGVLPADRGGPLIRGRTEVVWHGGGLEVAVGNDALLVDVPAGIERALGDRLGRLRAIVLTGGSPRAVGGLVPLLCALEPWRDPEAELPVHVPIGEDRGAALADAWVRHWPDRFPVTVDAERPGITFDAGPFEVTTFEVRAGEPRWRTGTVEPRVAVAVRVRTEDLVVVLVPAAAPSTVIERACRDADIAVIEVATVSWPTTAERWRPTAEEALRLGAGAGAKEVWLVGDDGSWVGGDET
jgi:hypothetical protein